MDEQFLRLLSKEYPNIKAASAEIINLSAILALPKGTEYFLSDLHGEHEAFIHMIKSASGVIAAKIDEIFGDDLTTDERERLAALVYNAPAEIRRRKKTEQDFDQWCRKTIYQLIEICKSVSHKYTRKKVRRRLPEYADYSMDELMHAYDEENRSRYYSEIINSIVECGVAEDYIIQAAETVSRLAVDRLHIIGDIFDRGSHPDKIMDFLMEYHDVDFQWGNHDILWLGAASGSPACIFTVLRISLDYGNANLLERRYGITLQPLYDFTRKYYGEATKENVSIALNTIGFKLEGRVIQRHPGYGMNSRLMLNRCDFENNTVILDEGVYPLNTDKWPTIDRRDPYSLNDDELDLVNEYINLFRDSQSLHRHMDFIYRVGSTYLCCNGNLLYHGCIPMTEDGEFARVRHGGVWYSGKSLMDYSDMVVKNAWAKHDESALDMMWYLWCGNDSPFSGRVFHTFERGVVDDQSTWEEPKNPYFSFWEDEKVAGMILSEFGLDPESGHIINGHTPVKAKKGESPVKAGGKLFIIDGGFCEAYQKTTGIAGYTLVFNSHGLKIKAHKPFEGVAAAIDDNADIESEAVQVESFERRHYISDCDAGVSLRRRIQALESLLSAYRSGELQEKE